MACTITDFADAATNLNVPQPTSISIIAQPGILPLFVKISGINYEMGGPTFRSAIPNAFTGSWTHVLPWPSECDPSVDKNNNPIQWLITMHDGAVWTGVVPEGALGPLTIKQLKDSFGWKLTVGQGLAQIAQIVGVQGPGGPAGAAEIVTADSAIDQFSLIKVSLTTPLAYSMLGLSDPPQLMIGVALSAASGFGSLFQAMFTEGLQTTLLSDGSATITNGQTLVPSTTVTGRVRVGTVATIGTALTSAAATLNALVQVR